MQQRDRLRSVVPTPLMYVRRSVMVSFGDLAVERPECIANPLGRSSSPCLRRLRTRENGKSVQSEITPWAIRSLDLDVSLRCRFRIKITDARIDFLMALSGDLRRGRGKMSDPGMSIRAVKMKAMATTRPAMQAEMKQTISPKRGRRSTVPRSRTHWRSRRPRRTP